MGQSATLYEIKEDVFKKIAVDPSCFEINMTRHYEVFEKNFEGLLFLLSKSVSIESKDIVQQIFYPLDYLGESIDFGSIDIGNLDEDSIFDNEPISYLTQLGKKVRFCETALDFSDLGYTTSLYFF